MPLVIAVGQEVLKILFFVDNTYESYVVTIFVFIEYCQELISVLSKLDSTGSRVPLYIAITKYELSAAILEISRRIFFETLNLSLIQEKGKEAKKLLTESVILLKEEKNSITCFQLIRSCKNLYKEIDDILTGKYFPDF